MSTEEDEEKAEFEKEIKELVRLVVEKAKKESMGSTKNAWGNFIEENSELGYKTFTRMYDRYILGDETKSIPLLYSLDSASVFIGYNSFAEFYNKIFPKEKPTEIKIGEEFTGKKVSIKSKNKFKTAIFGLGVATLGLGYFGISAYNQPQCMYWKGNSYEKVDCAEIIHPNAQIIPIDERLLEYLHKIEVSDTTTFFEAGKPIVWYLKVDGIIEFYSADGKHPINGKDLKPVTPYIIDKYIIANK
ncbi:hypothetical protein [Moheibacter sediminis]|uniref:Uncharacterized protein n=1 Tax=Moheibacter sediminis TaxID=1434700 RepID=A0A1W1Z3K4_9FLAO|nr:hypothetical protein [Moheibacter sediminis]SMC42538.1 hypothetical protein SAMN06296427_102128 [Moheibacter sediminis]